MQPEIKILAVSNVYCRLMNFNKAGDFEQGHYHSYDHGTLLAKGKLLVEKTDDAGNVTSAKVFTAPTFLFIEKDHRHVLTALEDNTVATCIHALRTIDETIIDSSFFIEETVLADCEVQMDKGLKGIGEVMENKGLRYKPLSFDYEENR